MSKSPHNGDPFDYNLAVVIGINQYQNGIPELKTARFDAERLAGILQTKYGYNVKLFTDEQAQSDNLWNYLEKLSEKIKSYDNQQVRVIFYFAGHGSPPEGEDGEAGYLVPQEAEIGKRDQWLSMKRVHDLLTQCGCHHLLIILDCCYAGAFRFGTRHIGMMPEDLSQERYQRYIEYPAGQVIASTAHNQEALDIINDNRGAIENSNHSPFAEYLFKALEEENADYTKDGITTATELNLYLYEQLLERTKTQKHPQVSRTWFLPTLDQGEFFFQTGEFDPEKLPEAIALNQENNPYRGLQPFEEAHSRFFFGRSEKVKELQERLNSVDRPLTVVLGISGSGKSSLVKAGLIPKLRENQAQWRILEPIYPGATVFKDLARAVLPLKLEDSDPDLEPLKQLDELLRQARRRYPHDEELKDLFAKWRRTAPEDKLLLIIKHCDRLKEFCQDGQDLRSENEIDRASDICDPPPPFLRGECVSPDGAKQSSLEALRKIGLSRSKLVLDNLKELKQYCNSAEREQLDNFYQKCKKQIQIWSDAWQRDGKQFGEFIAKYCPENKQVKLLLVVDQFEQAIAQCSQEERTQFLNALQAALKACPQQIRLVLTLRSDFQHYFENSEQLKEYWEKACFPVKQMERDQLREVIEQPALAQVLYFETNEQGKSLVDELLDDIGETPGALPLLSFTLSELYFKYVQKQRDDRTLTWEDYQELGGVTQSLTRRATEEYDNLAKDFVQDQVVEVDPPEAKARQTMLRWVMLRMVNLDGGEKAKRRVLDDELEYADKETKDFVIERFVDARLLVRGRNLEGKEYVEPIHDVLVREWPKIRAWLDGKPEEVKGKQKQPEPKAPKKWWFGMSVPSFGWNKKPESKQVRFDINLQRDLTDAALKYKEASEKPPKKAVDWLWDDDPRLPLTIQLAFGANYKDSFLNFLRWACGARSWQSQHDNCSLNSIELEFVEQSFERKLEKRRNTFIVFASTFTLLTSLTIYSFIQAQLSGLREKAAVARNELDLNPTKGLISALAAAGRNRSQLPWHEIPSVRFSLFEALELAREKTIFQKPNSSATYSASFIHEGENIVSCSSDGYVRLWDLSGKQIWEKSLVNQETCLITATSPSRGEIASGSENGKLYLLDFQGNFLQEFQAHNGKINGIAFCHQDKFIASVSGDGTLRIWNSDGGLITQRQIGYGWSVACHSEKPVIATGNEAGVLQLWHLENNELAEIDSRSIGGAIHSIDFSPDGQTVAASSGRNQKLYLWNFSNDEIRSIEVKGSFSTVRSVAFSPNGQVIAGGGEDNTLYLWDLQGNLITQPFRHKHFVLSIDFSPDGRYLVTSSGASDSSLQLWDLSPLYTSFEAHNSDVTSLAFSSNGETIVSGSNDGSILLSDIYGNSIWRVSHPTNIPSSISEGFEVVISPNNQRIASASVGSLQLWNIQGQPIWTEPITYPFDDPLVIYVALAFSPDSQMITTGSSNKKLLFYNLQGDLIGETQKQDGDILAVTFAPDNQSLVSSSREGTLYKWDKQGNLLWDNSDINSHGLKSAVSFSPNGKILLSGGWDKTIRFWDLLGKPTLEPIRHAVAVRDIDVDPRGKFFVSVSSSTGHDFGDLSEDNVLRLWDYQGHPIGVPLKHGNEVLSVAVSPNGEILASGGKDGTIYIWDLTLETLIKKSCERLHSHIALINAQTSDAKVVIDVCMDIWDLKQRSEFLENQSRFLAGKGN
jgi:WD40 repeat protein